jgi:F0F1-type ATP synthase membrane subunit c/vacuolar-type H+-ATPase subunit K
VVSVVLATGFCLVVVDSVVVVLVCAKANGAIAAQARIRMLFFILFPSSVVVFCFGLVSFLNRPLDAVRKGGAS